MSEQSRSVDRDEVVDCADLEEFRVRQSECVVDTAAMEVEAKLAALGLLPTTPADGGLVSPSYSSSCLSAMPPTVVSALLTFLNEHEREMRARQSACAQLERQREQDEGRLEEVKDSVNKVNDDIAFLSRKSGSEFEAFREHLKRHSESTRFVAREIADATRKREKAEMDARRTQMEIDRLLRISKNANIKA